MEKWKALIAGFFIQTILGGIYAWSAFVLPLKNDYGLTTGQCGQIFGTMIAFFAIAMLPAGYLLQRRGPRLTAGIGSVLFSTGYIIASLSAGNFYWLLCGLGVVTGSGIGFGYVCPLTVGMKWFPDNKGMVTGFAVGGFGIGAIFLNILIEYMTKNLNMSVMEVFRFIGIVFGGLAFISAMLISEPQKTNDGNMENIKQNIEVHVVSSTFWLICLGMFAGTFAGLLTVGNLKPLIASNYENKYATLSITFFAIGNTFGRILWGTVHDRFQSRRTIMLSLSFLCISLMCLMIDLSAGMALAVILMAGIAFGGCFVVYALSIVEYFGIGLFPRLYPICFLGYGMAGLIGPSIGGSIADITGSFNYAVLVSVLIVLVALITIHFRLCNPAAVKLEQEFS
jgi:OFA family oxalate/formate antiporter-like MFS transporter